MKISSAVAMLTGVATLLTFTQCFTERKSEGQRLYNQYCSSCHMEDGNGLRGVIPPLAGADYLQTHQDELPCQIRHGIEGSIMVNGKEYNQAMPGIEALKADQMTNLLNYIQTNFGNNNKRYTLQQVEQLLEKCPPHWR